MFQTLGPAPSKSGHAYSHVKCLTCGVEKTVRNSLLKADKVTCICAGVSPVQDLAPSAGRVLPLAGGAPGEPGTRRTRADMPVEQLTDHQRAEGRLHRAGQADPQIQNFPGTLAAGIEMHEAKHGPIGDGTRLWPTPTPEQMEAARNWPRGRSAQPTDPVQIDFATLEKRVIAYMTSTDKLIEQQAADFASWREKWEAQMRAFMENVSIGPVPVARLLTVKHGPPIKGTLRQVGAAEAVAEETHRAREPITYQSIVADLQGIERLNALRLSHRRGAALADMPFQLRRADQKRGAEQKQELLERWNVIIEQLDTCTDKTVYAALQPYAAKMQRSYENWDNENYDPTDYPINTETSA
jgi:hypothetical protein